MANSYLTRTPSSTGNRRKFTFSAWVKFNFNQLENNSRIFSCGSATSAWVSAYINANGTLQLAIVEGGNTYDILTNRLFRDESAWYHLVFVVDTENTTANNRLRMYVNGEEETSFSQRNNPTKDLDTQANTASKPIDIGSAENVGYSPRYFPGYMSHVAMVDGQVLTPTSFGETDSTSGIWKFKGPSGLSWGTNGFHLKFENSGALGADSSGQGNTFTVQGNLKQALDTPSNNHATLNSLDTGYSSAVINLANGNNTTMNTSGFGDYGIRSTLGVSKGKWYWECKNAAVNGGGGNTMAIIPMSKRLVINIMSASGPTAGVYGIQRYSDSSINIHTNGSVASQNTAMWGGITTSDVIGFALDMDNGKLYLSKNGDFKDSSGNTGNPATQANPTFTGISTGEFHGFYSELRMNNDNGLQVNFGNGFFGTTAITSAGSNGNGSLFEYDVPSGFYALNTKNLNTYG